MTRKLHTRMVFLLLLLIFQSMACAGAGQSISQTGTTQLQPQAAQSDQQVAGFDNPISDGGSEIADLISCGMTGFMLGAAAITAQISRQRAFPASARTIELGL